MDNLQTKRKMVMGLGNILNRDEGLGVHAVKALEERIGRLAPQVEFVDGGVLGLNLLPWVEESSHLLVLDAINAGKDPGTLIELSREEIPLYTSIKMSDHQVTFQEVLGMASFRGYLPEKLHLIGAQPSDLSIGLGLSPTVEQVLPSILSRAETVLRAWGLVD
jgi:hydrogenase maturation protease